MNKIIFLVVILLSLFSLSVVQAAPPTNQELASNDMRLADGIGQLRQNDMRVLDGISKMRTEIDAFKQIKQNGGHGTTVINDQDNQARQIGNRALAWAIYSQVVVEKTGLKPDIEDVERMLTPLEKGNMAPLAFETGLYAALKSRGWKLVDPITPLCPDQIKKICEEAIAKTIQELTQRVNTLESELKEVRKIAEDAAADAKGANSTSGQALDAANTAINTANQALGIVNNLPEPEKLDRAGIIAEAKATAEATARAIVPNMDQFATKKDLDNVVTCLEGKISLFKQEQEIRTRYANWLANKKDLKERRAIQYACLIEVYTIRGYVGDSIHGMAQIEARTWLWKECEVQEAACKNGFRDKSGHVRGLIDPQDIVPPKASAQMAASAAVTSSATATSNAGASASIKK